MKRNNKAKVDVVRIFFIFWPDSLDINNKHVGIVG